MAEEFVSAVSFTDYDKAQLKAMGRDSNFAIVTTVWTGHLRWEPDEDPVSNIPVERTVEPRWKKNLKSIRYRWWEFFYYYERTMNRIARVIGVDLYA